MAITLVPTKVKTFDDKAGNSYIVMEVNHVTGADSVIDVPDSAVSCAELPSTVAAPTLVQGAGSNTAAVNTSSSGIAIENETSGSSGLGFTRAAGDGVKQVIIDTAAVSGIYTIVVRCIGSAAGTGSTKEAGL